MAVGVKLRRLIIAMWCRASILWVWVLIVWSWRLENWVAEVRKKIEVKLSGGLTSNTGLETKYLLSSKLSLLFPTSLHWSPYRGRRRSGSILSSRRRSKGEWSVRCGGPAILSTFPSRPASTLWWTEGPRRWEVVKGSK